MGTQYLGRPGGRIAYEVRGEGPLVVCAPGMGDLRQAFRFLQADLVEAGFRVAVMDLRGHGDSDTTFDAYDDVAAGGDLLALGEHLGGSVLLVGNSMGAGAAAWAAAEKPELVTGLVLIGPFVRNPPIGRAAKLAFRVGLWRPWGVRVWDTYYASLFPSRPPEDLPAHRERMRVSLRRPAHWRAFVTTTRTSHEPVEKRLHEVQAPALVVMGERDRDFKDPEGEARFIAERLGGRVLMVPGAGHYPQSEFPEVVSPEVVRFAREILAPGDELRSSRSRDPRGTFGG